MTLLALTLLQCGQGLVRTQDTPGQDSGAVDAATPDISTATDGGGPDSAFDSTATTDAAPSCPTSTGAQSWGSTQICSGDHWCWSAPLPQGNDLASTWGAGPDDVWAVGSHGTILHWNGTQWRGQADVVAADLTGISGACGEIWAVGTGGAVVHWAKGAWTALPSPSSSDLAAVWANSPDDVWVAGSGGLWRWDGGGWTAIGTGSYLGVWSSGPSDVYALAVEQPSNLVHWNGSQLVDLPFSAACALAGGALWGSGPGDLWIGTACAEGEAVINGWATHWVLSPDGGAAVDSYFFDAPYNVLMAISGTGPSDVWLNDGYEPVHWDGVTFTVMPVVGIEATWSVGVDDVWAVGMGGAIAHYDGTALSQVNSPTFVQSVWANSDDDAWLGASPTSLHWNGTAWAPTLNAVAWAAGPSDGWSLDLASWNGLSWTAAPAVAQGAVWSIWGSSATDVSRRTAASFTGMGTHGRSRPQRTLATGPSSGAVRTTSGAEAAAPAAAH